MTQLRRRRHDPTRSRARHQASNDEDNGDESQPRLRWIANGEIPHGGEGISIDRGTPWPDQLNATRGPVRMRLPGRLDF